MAALKDIPTSVKGYAFKVVLRIIIVSKFIGTTWKSLCGVMRRIRLSNLSRR
jgi:hypothetical protein